MKKINILFLLLFFICLCAAVVVFADLCIYADKPADTNIGQTIIDVQPGQSFDTTSNRLHKEGIIQSPFKFKLLARLKGFDKKLKAGEYLLSGSMSPNKVLETMVNGTVMLYKMTVPEGYNIYQVAELVEQQGLGAKEDFLRAATDAALLRQFDIDAETFEGYLFPDTYYFPKSVTVNKIISTMVDRFWTIFTPAWKQKSLSLGMTIHQVVTLASIIEKETGAAIERPLISSVFHNRLRLNMRLESDPTVIYGIKEFDGNLTRKNLATETPYNTYKIKGLPPGPIANPGRESLEAALYPAETDYIYFVSKKDSTHYFSTNLSEHNQAVRRYQLRR